jgi:uncharacterized damage-inducible protein DinB
VLRAGPLTARDKEGRTPKNTVALGHLRALAFNNAWANRRLLNACLALSDDAFAAPRTGFFPSLRGTLNHNLVVDRFYVAAMEGAALGPEAFANVEPCATPSELMTAQTDVDRRLIAVAPDDNPRRVVLVRRDGFIQKERLDRLLLHLFEHQIHHRGQAHGMLSATNSSAGTKPLLRAAEFAALGFTEADVWDDPDA